VELQPDESPGPLRPGHAGWCARADYLLGGVLIDLPPRAPSCVRLRHGVTTSRSCGSPREPASEIEKSSRLPGGARAERHRQRRQKAMDQFSPSLVLIAKLALWIAVGFGLSLLLSFLAPPIVATLGQIRAGL